MARLAKTLAALPFAPTAAALLATAAATLVLAMPQPLLSAIADGAGLGMLGAGLVGRPLLAAAAFLAVALAVWLPMRLAALVAAGRSARLVPSDEADELPIPVEAVAPETSSRRRRTLIASEDLGPSPIAEALSTETQPIFEADPEHVVEGPLELEIETELEPLVLEILAPDIETEFGTEQVHSTEAMPGLLAQAEPTEDAPDTSMVETLSTEATDDHAGVLAEVAARMTAPLDLPAVPSHDNSIAGLIRRLEEGLARRASPDGPGNGPDVSALPSWVVPEAGSAAARIADNDVDFDGAVRQALGELRRLAG